MIYFLEYFDSGRWYRLHSTTDLNCAFESVYAYFDSRPSLRFVRIRLPNDLVYVFDSRKRGEFKIENI